MDRRLTPFNGRTAHVSLKDKVNADRFTEGSPAVVAQPVADLLPAPDVNARSPDRQLLQGDTVRVLDEDKGLAFVQSDKDGYVGWVLPYYLNARALSPATHMVSVRATHFYRYQDMKQSRHAWTYSLGSRVVRTADNGRFAQIRVPCRTDDPGAGIDGCETRYVPSTHLRPLDQPEADPVAVAERLLGTPYLWGGNSSFGIDCSGLVQIACHACGIACPGDSDMQQAYFPAAPDATYQRGDLLFWPGHVAWVSDPQTLIHANAHHMAVAHEPIATAIARISAAGDGPPKYHARLTR